MFVRFVREEEGQDLIEYALLAAFISIVALLAIQTVGTAVTSTFENVNDALAGGAAS
jgi:pilus assembly protein Flp/PilA